MIANMVEDFFLREGIKIPGDSRSTSSDEYGPESATKLEESFRRFCEADPFPESGSDRSGTDLDPLNSRFESLDTTRFGLSRREREKIEAELGVESTRGSPEDINLNINHRLTLDPLLQEALAGRPVENLDSYYESQPQPSERQHRRTHYQCHQRRARETLTYSEAYPDPSPYYMNTKSILDGIGASAVAMGLVSFGLRR